MSDAIQAETDGLTNAPNQDSTHEQVGFRQPSRPKPGMFRRFIERLAEDNRRVIGSARLDCCGLHQRVQKRH